jgi:hypothetical protein
MGVVLLLLTMAPAEANTPEPPVVGRPLDFSGAVGGPFTVTAIAEPTVVTAEEPFTLTLRIAGPGNLAQLPRPDLRKLDRFARDFAVEDSPDRFEAAPPVREFRYRLRPRRADVREVPRWKFVYFNPAGGPTSRGYMTTYTEPIALTVRPRPATPEAVTVPDWIIAEWEIEREPATERNPALAVMDRLLSWLGVRNYAPNRTTGPWLTVAAVLAPPVLCAAWYVSWRRAYPDAARWAEALRGRAAATALRRLKTADGDVEVVVTALLGYLRDRFGLPAHATTPVEVTSFLVSHGQPADWVTAVGELLRRCDEARFAPATGSASQPADAERLILDWEGVP